MNALTKIFRTVRGNVATDHAFENYYGQLVRHLPTGAPSAAEARRDFMAERASIERVSLY
jgi:hypothetical protein